MMWQNPGVSKSKPKTKIMNATETAFRFNVAYFAAQVIKTRKFGDTYVHVGAPHEFQHEDITFRVTGYGRSLECGGKKYKVHATRDGKPVPTTILRTLRDA
jgi:hypothetical protein